MRLLLSDTRIPHAVIVVTMLMVIAPISREWHDFAPGPENGEGENEVYDGSTAIHTGAEDVVVLDKPICPVLAKV
jgi:hypothetical protein